MYDVEYPAYLLRYAGYFLLLFEPLKAEWRIIMRLDKYLKVSRLIKRRTVANEACDAGRVLINGKTAKASASVKTGDIIEIQFGTKTLKVEVMNVQDSTKKEEAAEMYKEI